MTLANDAVANATALSGASGEVVVPGYGPTAASLESGESAAFLGYASLWWTWTCPASGTYEVMTAGTSTEEEEAGGVEPGFYGGLDTRLHVCTGALAIGSLTQVAANDDDPLAGDTFGVNSRVRWVATAGAQYVFRASLYSSDDEAWNRASLHLSWGVVLTGPAGAIAQPASSSPPWLPLTRNDFTVTATPVVEFGGAEVSALAVAISAAPDGYRLTSVLISLIEVTAEGEELVDSFPLNGAYFPRNGFTTQMSPARSLFASGGYDYYGDGAADSAGRTFLVEVTLPYPEGEVRYRSAPYAFTDEEGSVAFAVLSDVEAAHIYSHFWQPDVLYQRSRPGQVEPTAANTGPFGNRFLTIHAQAGTTVYVSGGGYSAYSSNFGATSFWATGVADETPQPYAGLVGPNLPGVTESIVTFRSYNPSAPSQHEDFAFRILWE